MPLGSTSLGYRRAVMPAHAGQDCAAVAGAVERSVLAQRARDAAERGFDCIARLATDGAQDRRSRLTRQRGGCSLAPAWALFWCVPTLHTCMHRSLTGVRHCAGLQRGNTDAHDQRCAPCCAVPDDARQRTGPAWRPSPSTRGGSGWCLSRVTRACVCTTSRAARLRRSASRACRPAWPTMRARSPSSSATPRAAFPCCDWRRTTRSSSCRCWRATHPPCRACSGTPSLACS